VNKHLVAGALALAVVSCSSGNKDLCTAKRVLCDDATLICDPEDGVCKCGGHGGVICPTGFVCDQDSMTCLSRLCTVDCTSKPGTSCDQYDNTCKCGGTGGKICSDSETCDPATKQCMPTVDCNDVACPRNQVCDTSSGVCKCGASTCMPTEYCSPMGSDGGGGFTCVNDVCARTHCAGANTCDPSDGYCKCNGVFCQSGEACACPVGSDGGQCDDSARSCQAGAACVGVSCDGGTLCDPVDGQCKCGGPGGPVCAGNQLCSLGPPSSCEGGAQCTLSDGGAKQCPAGFSCDTEDGLCKCGGMNGQLCAPGDAGIPPEVCVLTTLQQSCKRPCDIRTPDCPTGLGCYFDSEASTPVTYCAAPTGVQDAGQPCNSPTQCYGGAPPQALHCNGLAPGVPGLCEAYCDVANGMGGCVQTPVAESCSQIANAPTGYGYCQSVE
jgi:hypothetical protein